MAGRGAQNTVTGNQGQTLLRDMPGQLSGQQYQDALSQYGSGKTSLADALKSMRTDTGQLGNLQSAMDKANQKVAQLSAYGDNPATASMLQQAKDEQAKTQAAFFNLKGNQEFDPARTNQLFSSPLTGMRAAADQVRENPLTAGMFGQGGIQDQRQASESDLMGRGYTLQPEDFEAYGQASDNIARMFGKSENSLGQALARHGLSTGASGGAVAGYSGLQGNKLEQLAGQQRQIAQARMQTNLQRLTAMQQAVNQGQGLAQNAQKQQFDANQQGVKDYNDMLTGSANAGQREQDQANADFQQHEATKGPGIGDVLGSVGGSILGAATGGVGSALGAGLGNAVGGAFKPGAKAADYAYGALGPELPRK